MAQTPSNETRLSRSPLSRTLRKMLIAVLLILLAIVCATALQVDDWSRDLSTNRAETSAESKNPKLRPLDLTVSVNEVSDAIQRFVDRSPGWRLVNTSPSEGNASLELTRTTRVLRFVDDITVELTATETGTHVDVVSQSRVGKGDLGQNPRNIQALLEQLSFLRGCVSTVEKGIK